MRIWTARVVKMALRGSTNSNFSIPENVLNGRKIEFKGEFRRTKNKSQIGLKEEMV